MRYLLAIFLPPLAVLLCGKPFAALLNCFLTLLFYIPGVVHAFWILNHHLDDKRAGRVVHAISQQTRAIQRQADRRF